MEQIYRIGIDHGYGNIKTAHHIFESGVIEWAKESELAGMTVEYEGNLIYLLQSGCDFVRNNSKVRFVKEARYRIDKPDYVERAVTEAIVNALIHRDYIVLGSEIHINMYDDRIEIQSPGGMFEGMPVQECDIEAIGSVRRNPVIADLFHRMKQFYVISQSSQNV